MGAQAVRLSNVDIDKALNNKDFEVLFQPIFDLGNGALARVETFVRWRHPTLGVLPPGAFISFFESQGRMSELTRYVLDQALTQYVGWRGPYAPGFSINLALSDLSDGAFASHFSVLTRERGFPAELVTLECPMPPVDMDLETAGEHFQRLAKTGARLAIEVRGRANDFLRTIEPFPFVEIKTGGAAILRFARTVRGPGLSAISELLELAGKTNAAITAVGVEDQASLSALRGLGFSAAQGNHLGRVGLITDFTPSRVNEVRELLELAPLTKEDLAALFRTSAPEVNTGGAKSAKQAKGKSAGAVADDTSAPGPAPKDDLVERLAARIAQTNDGGDAISPETSGAPGVRPVTAEDRRKAAAIARARKKAATNGQNADGEKKSLPARDLQDRLSKEFEAFVDEPAAGENQADERSDAPPAQPAPGAPPALKKGSDPSPATPIINEDAVKSEELTAEPPATPVPAASGMSAPATTTNAKKASAEAKSAQSTKVETPIVETPIVETPGAETPGAETNGAETNGAKPVDAAAAETAAPVKAALIATPGEQGENLVRNPAPEAEDDIQSNSDDDADEIGVANQAASLTADETPRDADAFSLPIPAPTARFRPGIRVGGADFDIITPQEDPITPRENPITPREKMAAPVDDAAGPQTETAEFSEPVGPASGDVSPSDAGDVSPSDAGDVSPSDAGDVSPSDESQAHDAPAEITATDSLPAPTPVDQVTDDSAEAAQAADEKTGDGEGTEAREEAWIEDAAALEEDTSPLDRKNFLTREYQWPGKLWRAVFWPDHFWPRSWTQSWERREAEKVAREEEAAADVEAAYDEQPESDADTPRQD